jgi:predicted transposase YbfD/YdcC
VSAISILLFPFPVKSDRLLVSAFVTNSRLVLGQEAVYEKSNEITAIPALVERLNLEGALVSIDAMGRNPNIAQSILDAKADYLLAVKDNQPTLDADIKSYFDTAPAGEVELFKTIGKDHGRFEVRMPACIRSPTPSTSTPSNAAIRALLASRNSPPSPWSKATSSAATKIETERRSYISSRALSAADSRRLCEAIGPSKTTWIGPST